ncbi:hypothetical protein L6R53_13975 [Myxococcota bacterium]|nr:hypothetical protein [Myxococcota bacterium]
MIFDAETIALWAFQAVDELEPGPDASVVRLRLDPSPLPPRQTIRVDWVGARTADALADEIRTRLTGRELPADLAARIEVLDGGGAAIRGMTARTRWRSPAATPTTSESSVGTSPSPAPSTRSPQAGQVIEAEVDIPQELDLIRQATGGAPPDTTPEGWARWSQGLATLAFVSQQRQISMLLGERARMLDHIERQSESIRRSALAGHDLVDTAVEGMVTATRAAADARADATIAQVEQAAAEELAAATGKAPRSKVDDLQTIAKEVRSTIAEVRRTEAMRMVARGQTGAQAEPAKDGAAPSQPPPAPGVTPPDSPPPPPAAEEPSMLDRLLGGDIPAAIGAELVLGYVPEEKKAHAVALARAILASAGEEVSP